MSELTLAEVLLARIAEDRRTANEATMASWDAESPIRTAIDALSARRVLADCEAKRRIVELHTPVRTARAVAEGKDYESCPVCDPFPPIEDPNPGPCETLRLLALPYREEFKP